MAHWLLKSEPDCWSWDQQKNCAFTPWDGVRNYQACANMKRMSIGDLCFFYHSGKEKKILGTVKVVKNFYPDLEDLRFGMVDVAFVDELEQPVTLARIKDDPRLQSLALVRQSRLSVMPIDDASWSIILKMGQKS